MLKLLYGNGFSRGSISTLVSAMMLVMIVLMLMFKILYMYEGMYMSLTSGFEYMRSSLRNTMFITPCNYGVGICIMGSRGNVDSLNPNSLYLILPSSNYPLVIKVDDSLLETRGNMLVPTLNLRNIICRYGYGVLVTSSGNSLTLTCSDFNSTYMNSSVPREPATSTFPSSYMRTITLRPGYITTLNGVSVPASPYNMVFMERWYTGSIEGFVDEVSAILDYTYVVIPIRRSVLLARTSDEYRIINVYGYSVTLKDSLNVYHDNAFLLVIRLVGQAELAVMDIYSITVTVNVDGVVGKWSPGFLSRYKGWVLEYPPAHLVTEVYAWIPSVSKEFYALLPPGNHSISVSVTVRGDVLGNGRLILSVEAWSLDFTRDFNEYSTLLVVGTGEKLDFIPDKYVRGGVYFVDMVYTGINEHHSYLEVYKLRRGKYYLRQFGYGWLVPSLVPKPSYVNPNPTLYWLKRLGADTNITIKYYVPSKAILLATPGVYVDLGDKLILVNNTVTYIDVDGLRDTIIHVPHYLVFTSNREVSDTPPHVTSLQAPLTFHKHGWYYKYYLAGLFTWTPLRLGVSEYYVNGLGTIHYNLYSTLILLYVPRGSGTAKIYSLVCYGIWYPEGRYLVITPIHIGVNDDNVNVSPSYSPSCPYTTQTKTINIYSSYKQLQDPVGYTAILLGKIQDHTSNTMMLAPVKP